MIALIANHLFGYSLAYPKSDSNYKRQELLNHIIPLSERHLERLLDEYINDYYNTDRTHQGIDGKTPIEKPTYIPVDIKNFKIKATPVLNGLYHTYERVA